MSCGVLGSASLSFQLLSLSQYVIVRLHFHYASQLSPDSRCLLFLCLCLTQLLAHSLSGLSPSSASTSLSLLTFSSAFFSSSPLILSLITLARTSRYPSLDHAYHSSCPSLYSLTSSLLFHSLRCSFLAHTSLFSFSFTAFLFTSPLLTLHFSTFCCLSSGDHKMTAVVAHRYASLWEEDNPSRRVHALQTVSDWPDNLSPMALGQSYHH